MNHRLSPADDDNGKDKADKTERSSNLMEQLAFKSRFIMVFGEIDDRTARATCERLMSQGVLVKDTHETTIRIAPPIVIDEADLDDAVDKVLAALA